MNYDYDKNLIYHEIILPLSNVFKLIVHNND